MNIFEYIDKKRAEYENLRDESQLQLKKNQNRIQRISSQIEKMTEEEENPSQFFLPESTENYKEEIEKLQEKIAVLESEDDILFEKIELCENEIDILDTLELPNFSSDKENMEWKPMRVSEEDIQKKIVSHETMNSEILSKMELEKIPQNVSRETFLEKVDNGDKNTEGNEEIIDRNLIKEKICFCRQISELDPRRCGLLLDEIINEIL